MKKLIAILFLVPMLALGQTERRGFTELNIGVASIYGYDFGEAFPGLSFLVGQTFTDKGLVTEYQIGLAAPSILTGKLAIGGGNLDKNIMVACRPWPLFFGPQVKLGWFSASFEVGFDDEISFDAGLIATIGFRWKLKKKKKNVHSNC